MQGGILNEPVRENAEKLMKAFGHQMNLDFSHMIFVAVTQEGDFRSANYTREVPLNADAIRLIAQHLNEWADSLE